jgi:hypothetical protein
MKLKKSKKNLPSLGRNFLVSVFPKELFHGPQNRQFGVLVRGFNKDEFEKKQKELAFARPSLLCVFAAKVTLPSTSKH